MKLPFFKAGKTVKVNVAAFDGGMNMTDAPWLMQDNQLADCRNMWFQNGLLRTRAGFWTSSRWKGKETPGAPTWYVFDSDGWLVGLSLLETGTGATLTVTGRAPSGGEAAELLAVSVPLGTTFACVPSVGTVGNDTLLLYVSDGRIWALQPSLWTATEVTSRIYVPTVTVNGRPMEGRGHTHSEYTEYQKRNRLTDRVRCCYTPDGVGMYYDLPYRNIQGDVRVCMSGLAGSVWEYLVPAGQNSSEIAEGRYVVLERQNGLFYFQDKNGDNTVLPEYGSPNSVVAECHVPWEEPSIFAMTFGVWYGGDKSTTGGHRLFLSGNPQTPHTVVWSVADNPFYFPENACTTVGLSDDPITAFGKQDGHLVIFKERELYAAEYVRGGRDTTDTDEAVLPIYALHSEVGCDCPDSVALMDGRLTWTCRDGNVYQLKNLSSTGGRAVIAVGKPIYTVLRERWGVVSARVWEGNYYLLYGQELWVLTDAEKATWYRFVWPENGTQPRGLFLGPSLQILGKAGHTIFWFSLYGTQDVNPILDYQTIPVIGMMQTKGYDFEHPTAYKHVSQLAIQTRSTVAPLYKTENRVYADGAHRADGGGMVMCTPNIRRCRLWSLQLEGEQLAVGGITAVARTEGGI